LRMMHFMVAHHYKAFIYIGQIYLTSKFLIQLLDTAQKIVHYMSHQEHDGNTGITLFGVISRI
jgi:hypothetical protein